MSNISLFKKLMNCWLLVIFLVRLIDYDYFYNTKEFFFETSRTFLGNLASVQELSLHTYLFLLVMGIVVVMINYMKDNFFLTLIAYVLYLVLIYSRMDSIIGGDSLFYIVGFWNILLREKISNKLQDTLNFWIILTIQFQICLIYLVNGIAKAQSPIWQQGVALHYILNVKLFNGIFYNYILASDILILFLSYSTIIFQLAFPFLMFSSKKTKYLAMILGIGFHLGSILVLNLPRFSIFIITYSLFWNQEEFKHIVIEIKEKLQSRFNKLKYE